MKNDGVWVGSAAKATGNPSVKQEKSEKGGDSEGKSYNIERKAERQGRILGVSISSERGVREKGSVGTLIKCRKIVARSTVIPEVGSILKY